MLITILQYYFDLRMEYTVLPLTEAFELTSFSVGAKLPHLQKYTSTYREQYPNTTIILIRSEAAFFWSTERTQVRLLIAHLS